MASTNTKVKNYLLTYEGGMASVIKPLEQLKRSVMSCLLWEDTFYEDGVSIADRVRELIGKVPEDDARQVLTDAKFKSKLRHMPLFLLTLFAEQGWLKKEDVARICTRVDDLAELLAIYCKDGKKPFDHQLVKGLAMAITKFDEYAFAKYNRARTFKLRDVFRIARPKPATNEQSALWKKVVKGELATPDTWEVAISACGSDTEKKAAEFTRLLTEKVIDEETGKEYNKLGDLAFLRNIRLMTGVGVDESLIRNSFQDRRWGWIIPYQFITAASHNPVFEDVLEKAMFQCLKEQETIEGSVALLVDVSGSMHSRVSGRSEVMRYDVAASLAILLKEVCKDIRIYSFNDEIQKVPPRSGFALRDAICKSVGGSTEMWKAVRSAGKERHNRIMVVITDEQTADKGRYSDANADLLVIINVASYQNGVGYEKGVVHINGWSDSVIAWLREYLKEGFEKR